MTLRKQMRTFARSSIRGCKKGIKDKNVQLIGFGTFQLQIKTRDGVNPQTGEKIKIKASKSAILKLVLD